MKRKPGGVLVALGLAAITALIAVGCAQMIDVGAGYHVDCISEGHCEAVVDVGYTYTLVSNWNPDVPEYNILDFTDSATPWSTAHKLHVLWHDQIVDQNIGAVGFTFDYWESDTQARSGCWSLIVGWGADEVQNGGYATNGSGGVYAYFRSEPC